jgi:hypothetical protein
MLIVTQGSFEASTGTHTGMPQFINNNVFHQGPQQFTVRDLEVFVFLMYYTEILNTFIPLHETGIM